MVRDNEGPGRLWKPILRRKARPYDSHATPPSSLLILSKLNIVCRSAKKLVRFSVGHQFSAHTPLLVETPVNSFEFEPYDRSSPAEYLTR